MTIRRFNEDPVCRIQPEVRQRKCSISAWRRRYYGHILPVALTAAAAPVVRLCGCETSAAAPPCSASPQGKCFTITTGPAPSSCRQPGSARGRQSPQAAFMSDVIKAAIQSTHGLCTWQRVQAVDGVTTGDFVRFETLLFWDWGGVCSTQYPTYSKRGLWNLFYIWLPDLKNSLHDGVKLWRTLKLLKETSFCVNELEGECIPARLQRRALHFYSCQYMYLYIFFISHRIHFMLIWDNDFIMIRKLKTNKQ